MFVTCSDALILLCVQNKTFVASNQEQRGGLTLLNGTVYIPYGGLNGDCAQYYGVVVGIPLRTPTALRAYISSGNKGGMLRSSVLLESSLPMVNPCGSEWRVWTGGSGIPEFRIRRRRKDRIHGSAGWPAAPGDDRESPRPGREWWARRRMS